MKVEIGFDLAPNGVGDWFTLDDATKGELDNSTYLLSGEVLVDVSSKVRDVAVNRGRSRTLERFTAGVASVTLDNRDRQFDPLNADGPYYGSITPRRMVRISRDGENLFTGNVEEWSWGYALGGDATATMEAVDGLALLANATLTVGTATSQKTGARVSAVLNDIGWSSTMRDISTGQATLDADVVSENTNALGYLSTVADISEPGAFFMSKSGAATFRDRTDLQDFADSGVKFGGSGGIPFQVYDATAQTTELKNKVVVTWYAGTAIAGEATSNNMTSQANYGVFAYRAETLLDDSTQATYLAAWLVGRYAQPQYWIDRISVNLNRLTDAQVAQVLGLELADPVLVEFAPPGGGSPISQYLVVDKIEHQVSPARHDVTFTMSPGNIAFILDNATFGQLDDDNLGF